MPEITLETVLAAVNELRATTETRFQRLEDSQTRLRTDLLARMDRLQKGLDGLREGYIVDWGHVDRATCIAQNALEETRSFGDQIRHPTKWMHRLEAQIRELRGRWLALSERKTVSGAAS